MVCVVGGGEIKARVVEYAISLQKCKIPRHFPISILDMTPNRLYSHLEALGNVEYFFITITLRSTLTPSGNGPVWVSYIGQIELLMLNSNTCNHLCKTVSSGLFKNVTYKLFLYKSCV